MGYVLRIFAFLTLVSGAHAAPTLVGTWSGVYADTPLTVTFGSDGSGTVNQASMRWQVMGNLLFIEQDGEVTSYQMQQQGASLVVSGGNFASPVLMKRGLPTKPAAATTAPMQGKQASSELIGKWCKGGSFSANGGGGSSSMICFQLLADGSYRYAHEGSMSAYAPGAWGGTASQSSDNGQWSVSGSVLTARSANGQVNNYRLEKRNHPKNRDPMVCLDGDCYTTYWQKSPW